MNSQLQVSVAFPVSSTLTARRVAPGPSPTSSLLLAVSEDGEVLEIDTNARASADAGHSSSAAPPPSVLRRCRVHSTVGVSIDRSHTQPNLYVSCGESTWAIWHVGDDQPVFVSPPCPSSSHYCSARWSPTRPAVVCLGRSDGVLEVWDCLDQTHQAAYTFPTGSSDAVVALQFQPPPNAHLDLTRALDAAAQAAASSAGAASNANGGAPLLSSLTAPSSVYSSSARQYLAAGDGGGKCHIVEVPRPLRRRLAGEDAAMLRWIERERSRGKGASLRALQKSRGQSILTPYQQQMQRMPQLFASQDAAAASQASQASSDGGDGAGEATTASSANSAAALTAAADAASESEYATLSSSLLAGLDASLKAIEQEPS